MQLPRLIDALSQPEAYPHPVGHTRVIQTHASVVFLAGDFVYKVKKPVDFGFLDYSTLERRRHFCEREVALNRRLAPAVYLGVVGIGSVSGRVRVGVDNDPFEYAVKMVRLPEQATLHARLLRDELTATDIERLAIRVAAFHREADRGEHVSRFAQYEVVESNSLDNLRELERRVGVVGSARVIQRLAAATKAELERWRSRIEDRARSGIARDTHGDLRLEHVYYFPGAPPPADLRIVDCIEFNDRFRHADPIADAAFLAMDLRAHGAWELARRFEDAYITASGDTQGRALFPLYTAYRAAVRAKVAALRADQDTPHTAGQSKQEAIGHVLLADGLLRQPDQRACMVLMCGLPGTGKSVLAGGLAAKAGFEWLRSDVVRKELHGLHRDQSGKSDPATGIYDHNASEVTYQELQRRVERALFEGKRVIVDATFKEDRRRRAFVELARAWGVPVRILVCETSPEVARHRIENRHGDVSDADWAVYLYATRVWEPLSTATAAVADVVDTTPAPEAVVAAAVEVLERRGCAGVREATAGPPEPAAA